MTQREVEEAILELLAAELGCDASELERELKEKGHDLPIASPTMVTIILDLEERFSIQMPDDTATAESMCSVRALAQRVCDVATRPQRGSKSK